MTAPILLTPSSTGGYGRDDQGLATACTDCVRVEAGDA